MSKTWAECVNARTEGRKRAKAQREKIAVLERAVLDAAEKYRDVPSWETSRDLLDAVDALRKARAL